jgi:hypothetical protein
MNRVGVEDVEDVMAAVGEAVEIAAKSVAADTGTGGADTGGIGTGSGRVTIDDVASAIEHLGVTPNNVNAARIREVLGRGSLGTIQKHLDAIRTLDFERRKMSVASEIRAPIPPEHVERALAGIWSTCWEASERQHFEAIVKGQQDLDIMRERFEAAQQDVSALTAELDEARRRVADAEARAEAAERSLQEREAAIAVEKRMLEQMMERLEVVMASVSSTTADQSA